MPGGVRRPPRGARTAEEEVQPRQAHFPECFTVNAQFLRMGLRFAEFCSAAAGLRSEKSDEPAHSPGPHSLRRPASQVALARSQRGLRAFPGQPPGHRGAGLGVRTASLPSWSPPSGPPEADGSGSPRAAR